MTATTNTSGLLAGVKVSSMTSPTAQTEREYKFRVGDEVFDMEEEECATVEQIRVENTWICYRLSNGRIVNESKLRG
jgi:hypothetical protein